MCLLLRCNPQKLNGIGFCGDRWTFIGNRGITRDQFVGVCEPLITGAPNKKIIPCAGASKKIVPCSRITESYFKKMEAFFDASPDAQVHMGGAVNVFLNILNDNSFSSVDCSKKMRRRFKNKRCEWKGWQFTHRKHRAGHVNWVIKKNIYILMWKWHCWSPKAVLVVKLRSGAVRVGIRIRGIITLNHNLTLTVTAGKKEHEESPKLHW